jgi:hypothetical protein
MTRSDVMCKQIIHDSVGKALRTADQGHVTTNSHALSPLIIVTEEVHTEVSLQVNFA